MATVFAVTSSGHASSSSPSLSATAVIPVANGDDHAANQGNQDDTAVVQSRKKSSTSSSKIKSSRRHKFHKTFPHFAHDEVLLNAFSCAFFGDILLQGHLYVSTRMFSFYCRILGQEKRIEIPMKDVLRITREKTAIFIPNAIGILTADNKYTFGSLLQRNVTYNLMVTVWKANQAELADSLLLPVQDTSSKLDETESVSLSLAKASSDRDDNDASIDSDVSSSSRLTEPFLEAEDNSVSSTSNTGVQGDQSTLRLSASPSKKGSTSSSSTFMYLTLPCLPLVKALYIANRMLAKMHSLPRTSVMLLLLLVIVSFLMFITMLLTYKVIALQAQLSGNCAAAKTGPVAAAMYDLRQATHDTSVDRIHAIMESTALLLNEIHGSLESLRRPFGRDKS